MTAIVPALLVFLVNQSKVCLMDKHSRLNRLARFLVRQLRCPLTSEFLIDERQELIGCRRITLLNAIRIRETSLLIAQSYSERNHNAASEQNCCPRLAHCHESAELEFAWSH